MPIHIAITRRIRPGCEAEFQQELREFFQQWFAHAGVLGATMLVPPTGADSRVFGILRTFAGEQERDALGQRLGQFPLSARVMEPDALDDLFLE